MGRKVRTAQAVEGPDITQSTWIDMGDVTTFATFTSTSTATITPVTAIMQPTSGYDYLAPGTPISRLQGGQVVITGSTAMAAQSTLNLGWVVYRNFGTLGTQITNAGGALTSLTIAAPGVNTAMPSGQTFTLVNAAGTVQTWTTSAAVVRGALTIAVTSQTPTGTNAVGNALVGQVGNGILFGWLAATGTPAFYLNQATSMPAINANITAGGGNTLGDPFGPFVYLYPGDVPSLSTFSAGSVTVQAGLASYLAA